MAETFRPGRYRHFKGGEYELIGLARHSETGEELVLYRALYGERGLWVRPKSMWNEPVVRDGVETPRFRFIGQDQPAAFHLGTQTLQTERLTLRRFVPEDAQPMYENWASDPEVTRYLTWPPHADPGITKRVLEEWIGRYGDPAFYQWAVVPRRLGQPIGGISVVRHDDALKSVAIGYCIGRNWWRQGVASEALAAVIAFFFDRVGMARVESWHDVENPHSGMVMQKCGMRFEGVRRGADINQRGVCDVAHYGMLREDYAARRP